jgi:hypothetical protein
MKEAELNLTLHITLAHLSSSREDLCRFSDGGESQCIVEVIDHSAECTELCAAQV